MKSISITRSGSGAYTLVNGTRTVFLTRDEVNAVRKFMEHEYIYDAVEYAVKKAEDDDQISFDSWQDAPFSVYSSEDDARSDFVEYVANSIIEDDEDFDRNPIHSEKEFDEFVLEYASDCDWLTD